MKIYIVVVENKETGEKHVVEDMVFYSEKVGRVVMDLAYKGSMETCKVDLHLFEV
jgi:hypothetical protein